MPGCAATVVAWQGGGGRVNANAFSRAIEGVEISYARDGRQSELTITHAPHP